MIKPNRDIPEPKANENGDVPYYYNPDLIPTESGDFREEYMKDIPTKFFRDTRVGRFLSLRTKASKTVAGILATLGSNLLPAPVGGWIGSLTGNLITLNSLNMDLFEGLNIVQMIIVIVAFVITVGLPIVFPSVKKWAGWKLVDEKIDIISDELQKAVDEKSEGGQKITRNEIKSIIISVFKSDETKE